MDDEGHRRSRLRSWVDDHYEGNVAAFCRAAKLHQPYIAQALSGGKPFGEKLARKVERQGRLPHKYLEAPTAMEVREPQAAYHGIMLTRAAAELAAEWDKMDVSDRIEIEAEIHKRVAKKVRDSRRKPSPLYPKDEG